MSKRRRKRLYLGDGLSMLISRFSVVRCFGFRCLNIVVPHMYANSRTIQVNCRNRVGKFSYEQLMLMNVGVTSWIIDGVGSTQHAS